MTRSPDPRRPLAFTTDTARSGHPWHHVPRCSTGLVTLLARELRLTVDTARELVWLGAVAVDGVRVTSDVTVPAGARVTAYRQPRRFPAALSDWRHRPLVDLPTLAIFAKPHAVPTVATADNARETALAGIEAALGRRCYVTHRLDTGAAGLLVVAKSPEAQAMLDRLFRERLVEKEYRVLARAGLAPGHYRHFLAPGPSPRSAFAEPIDDGEVAELAVESAEPFSGARYPKELAEYRIRLFTGRTHQIRAQLAALGFPIVGDKAYGGPGALPRPAPRGSFALVATRLAFETPAWGTVTATVCPTWRADA